MLDDKTDIPADWDRSGLPGWTYFSQELFDLERDVLFRTHWQLVCHISEVATPGQYVTLDIAGFRSGNLNAMVSLDELEVLNVPESQKRSTL